MGEADIVLQLLAHGVRSRGTGFASHHDLAVPLVEPAGVVAGRIIATRLYGIEDGLDGLTDVVLAGRGGLVRLLQILDRHRPPHL